MELRQLRCFIAVAEERHFGRAAERLHMAQPPLSQQIRQLEGQLGARLLERTTRRVDLTPAGQELLDRGRRLVREVEALTADVRRMGDGSTGALRVGFSDSATCGLMPRVVRAAGRRLPGVALTVQGEVSASYLETGLRERTLDAALLRPPVASPGIEHRTVRRERLVVALSAEGAPAPGRAVPVAELREQTFVCHPPESVVHRAVHEMCRRHGFAPRIGQVVEEPASMLCLVAAGGGVAVIPESVRALRVEGVVYAELEDSPLVELALAWRREDRSPVLGSFLTLAQDVLEQE